MRLHDLARHVVGEGYAPGVGRIGLLEMLDQRDRDILDLEANGRLGMHIEGVGEGRTDRAAVSRRYDISATILSPPGGRISGGPSQKR